MTSMDEPLSPKFTENDLLTMRYMNIIDEGDNIARKPVHSQSAKIQSIDPVYTLSDLKPSYPSWDFNKDKIDVEEKIVWLEQENQTNYTEKQLNDWIKVTAIDPNTEVDIAGNANFCDKGIARKLFNAKRVFERLPLALVYSARTRANPFETVKSAFFINRAALKMSNIDAACDFLFTTIEQTEIYQPEKTPIAFADLCAGPGGFSEYILYRKRWLYKGYGITLKTPKDNDFQVLKSDYASAGSFQALYGPNCTGDVRNPDVFNDFIRRVNYEASPGVYFVMCDGGIPVVGVEGNQEILMKHLIVCQVLIALAVLRKGGHFVMKHFDMFSNFSVGLFYLLHNCFTRVGVIKPNASRPANSERYIVCSGFFSNQQTTVIKNILMQLAEKLWAYIESKVFVDLVQIVPVEEIKSDVDFTRYIVANTTKVKHDEPL